MYSTCVSEWRVPLMNVTAEMTGRRRRERLLRAEAVLDGHHRRAGPVAGEPRRRGVELGRLGGDDRELRLGQLGGVGRRARRA